MQIFLNTRRVSACGALFALVSIAASSGAFALEPLVDCPQPVANDGHVKAKIAMIGFANNPYWVSVQKGVETANQVLSSNGGEVKWIVAGANIDVPTVDQAIRAAATRATTASASSSLAKATARSSSS